MKAIETKIELPQGVSAIVQGHKVSVSGSGKKNERTFHAEEINIATKGNTIFLNAEKDNKKIIARMNSIEAHLKNMIKGLQKDFEYKLTVVFSHFPMTVAVKGNIVEINNFGGEKKPRKIRIFGNTKVQIKGKDITVTGSDKEDVGQTAAGIENASHVKGGKDKRVFQDGIYLVQKSD